jgi:hypothetical protein
MERELLKFGGGVSQTIVNPVVLILVLLTGYFICTLPRAKAVVPFLVASVVIPIDQVLLVGPFHFPMLRVLILFGVVRILITKMSSKDKLFTGGMNKIDVTVMLLALITAVDWMLLWQQTATLIYQLGEIYTVFGTYLLMRFLVRDHDDIQRVLQTFAYIAFALGLLIAAEQATGWNPYALLGGANASFFASTMQRGERFRATGPFGHPILAGTFGAVILPLFIGLWWTGRKNRRAASLGIIGSTLMVIGSNSSTPVLAYLGGIFALCLWPLRNGMRVIRWGILTLLIALHMVMKAPVWNLIARIDVVGGSSGDHRYQLVNQCILHFKDWWFVGVKNNGQWGWDMWDTANQYVSLCVNSGLAPLVLFVAIISYGFQYVGRGRRYAGTSKRALLLWSLGAALFAHAIGFFGISYFDQTIIAWYALLAVLSAAVLPQAHVAAGVAKDKVILGSEVASPAWEGAAAALASNESQLLRYEL